MLDKCLKEEYSALCKKAGTRRRNFYRNLRLVLAVVFLFITWAGSATNYYVSNSGNDSNSGTTPETAWQTISKVNNTKFAPGDQILFKRGGVWREQLIVSSSGAPGSPIVFGAYGNGEKPVIDGADRISDMTSAGGNIWQKTGINTQPYLMYLNDIPGDLQTSIDALDSEGEWFWDDSANTFYIYAGSNPSGKVEIGQRYPIINVGHLTAHNHVTLSDLTIMRANQEDESVWYGGIYARNLSDLTINNCTVQQCNGYGAFFINVSNLTINNCNFTGNGLNSTNYTHFADNVRYYSSQEGNSNIVFRNNVSNNAGRNGFFMQSSSISIYANNIHIYGNTFNDNQDAGLYLQKTNNVVIYNNTFDGNGTLENQREFSEDYAIGITRGDNIDIYQNIITNQLNNDAIQIYTDETGGSENVRIFRNRISRVTSGDGIQIIGGDYTTNNLQIFYNVIDLADDYGIVIYKYNGTESMSTSYIYNNTILNNVSGGLLFTAAAGIEKSIAPIVLKNNIFCNNGSSRDVYIAGATSGFNTSNNLYYRTGGNVLEYNTNTYTTATIASFEPTAHTKDPLFTDAANRKFTLKTGSPAINAGTDVGLTQDILGNPIVGTPDIGAYESQKKSDEAITKYTTEDISICEGESYEGWTTSGQYERTLTAASGADSIVTTNLTVHPVEYTAEDITIYEGEAYEGWTESGQYERTLTASTGCDSIVTTNLTVIQTIQTTEEIEICEGESYEGWTVSGEYERTLTASSGADSVVTTLLTVHPVQYTIEDITIYEGEAYEGWTESGEYERTLIASTGCDSIVTTNLTVLQTIHTTEEIEICEGESYEGWTTSGQYERTLTASSGADSVVTTLLTVHPVAYTSEDITIYEGEAYEGWTEPGQYERTLTAFTGCDSIVTTNLTVIQTIRTTEEIEICEGGSYEGWTTSGQYERTLTAASGADSIVTTNLTVHPVEYTAEDITIYEGEAYEGWTEPGQYERTLTASTGCDSIVTTNLTVFQTIQTTEEIEICEGESYEGWTISGQYERTLTASSGADSVVTTLLTVHPVAYTSEDITIYEGEAHEGWTEPGQYESTLTASTGCDSIVTTNLTVIQTIQTTEEIEICEGESYEGWTISGQYERTLTASSGADSVVTTLLTVHPVAYTTEDITIPEGESYQGWTTSGEYQRVLTSVSGCDSIVTIRLTVEPAPAQTEEVQTQTIQLEKGWNVFSSYINPENASMDAVMAPLVNEGNLIIVEDEVPNTYEQVSLKSTAGNWINNIGNVQKTEGYKIQVQSSCVLEITGTPVSLPVTIELKRGENLISFPLNGSVDAMQVIQPLIDDGTIKKVQDEKGNAIEWWRNLGWINGIGNFQPGEGYVIDAKHEGILTINDLTEKSGVFIAERPAPDFFEVCYEGNGLDHMNINMVELDATGFRAGDEIAAFDGEICVGAVKLTESDLINDAVSIPVSAAGPNGMNGFTEENPIELRVWHINKSAVAQMQSEAVEGELIYQKRASVFVQMTTQTTTGSKYFESMKIDMFPNPASDNVTIRFSTLPERGTRIELTDMTGKQLMVREVQSTQEVLNVQSQPAGMYLIKTISGDNYTVRKLIIN